MLGKAVLGISTLIFVGYGLVSLVSPAIPAGLAGLVLSNGDAYTEIGAMYGGLQIGVGLFCAMALLKPEFYRAGLMLLVLAIGTLALARLVSLLIAPRHASRSSGSTKSSPTESLPSTCFNCVMVPP